MSKHLKDPGWGMSDDQVTDFYARWREWMVAATHRGAFVVANPDHRGFFTDLMERLVEDPWWMLRHINAPPMMFKEEVPYDILLFWTQKNGLQTPAELMGRTGFGRLTAAAPSRDGVQPWNTADFKGEPTVLHPDKKEKPNEDS